MLLEETAEVELIAEFQFFGDFADGKISGKKQVHTFAEKHGVDVGAQGRTDFGAELLGQRAGGEAQLLGQLVHRQLGGKPLLNQPHDLLRGFAVGIGHGPGGNAQRNKGVDVPEQKAGQGKGVRRVAAVVKLDHVGDRLLVHG